METPVTRRPASRLPRRRWFGVALVLVLASLPSGRPAFSQGLPVGGEALIEGLIAAYPDQLSHRDENFLVWHDGTRLPIDDGLPKTHAGRLAAADIEDMLGQIYPVGPCSFLPPVTDFELGRVRSEAFFAAMYGASPDEVAAHLITIDWFGAPLRATSVNGVATALEAVRDDLARLPPDLHPIFATSAGTYNWRTIAGTDRLSVHSFGAAIDLNVDFADYWRWNSRTGLENDVPPYRNQVPVEVVEAFERHGFVWGGKWYRFDTMHFEYRPELIRLARTARCDG
jgi:hypothetical protein